MTETPIEEPTVPITIHGNISNGPVTFAICINDETGQLFLTAYDDDSKVGATLFAKSEELRKFARGIIQLCQKIN